MFAIEHIANDVPLNAVVDKPTELSMRISATSRNMKIEMSVTQLHI